MIWNDGSATIVKEDVISADPLTVHIEDPYKIVRAEITQATNSKNGFSESVSQDKRKVNLGLSFVDPGEGIVLRILHTGESSADLSVVGRIKDAGAVRCSLTDNPLSIERGRKISIRVLISTLFLISLGIASNRWLESIAKQKFGAREGIESLLLALVLATGFIALYGLISGLIFRRILKDNVPRGFEKFYDELAQR